MVKKLVMLCAEAIAKDWSETGHLRLRTLLESMLPKSVLLVALSSVPLNHLIQLEEDFPEHFTVYSSTVIREQWKELCKKCAKKDFGFRYDLRQALKHSHDGLGYKAFLLNKYFNELLDAVTTAEDELWNAQTGLDWTLLPVSCQYILRGALGQSRHNISDEKMLNVIAEHMTELTVGINCTFQLRQLIQANKNCMGRLKILKLDTWRCSFPTRSTDFTYCVKHILQRSPIQTLSITSCCTILKNFNCHLVKGRQVDEATLGLESDVNVSHDSDELSVVSNMVGDEAASKHHGIKELIVLKCSRHHTAEQLSACCSGLERLYSLERLTVSCNSSKRLTVKFLCAITKLLKCGSSQLKYLCIDGSYLSIKQIKELGQCLNAANDSKKEVIINNYNRRGIPNDAEEVFVSGNCPKFLKSTISNLTYSDTTLNSGDSAWIRENYMSPFTVFLKVYNPKYLNIYCGDNSPTLPNHSLQDVSSSIEGSNLRKLTVALGLNIHSRPVYDHVLQPIQTMLHTVNLILKEQSKEVDVHVFYEGEKPSGSDIYNSFFKTFEMNPLDKRDSAHSTEDFAAEM